MTVQYYHTTKGEAASGSPTESSSRQRDRPTVTQTDIHRARHAVTHTDTDKTGLWKWDNCLQSLWKTAYPGHNYSSILG